MEIEAKFAIPDTDLFAQFQRLPMLAGFALGAGQSRLIHDVYLDTPERALLAARYTLRQRLIDADHSTLTLKGLGRPDDAIYRREQWEIALPVPLPPPHDWPAGPLRDRVIAISGDAELITLIDLRQQRFLRRVQDGAREVAELSLDEVTFRTSTGVEVALILEVELQADGDEADLQRIAEALRDQWELRPSLESKFEHGLALHDDAIAKGATSTP